jgi:D-glycero-D-manno-heptose 1,7-bisphosphate phosphatase
MAIVKVRGPLPLLKNELVILDRDGTLNIDLGYSFQVSQLKLIDGVIDTLTEERFNNSIFAIASNQAGISKGKFSIEQSIFFTETLCDLLSSHGIQIAAFTFCPHDDYLANTREVCEYRKPNPGMLNLLMNLFGIQKESTLFVGNSNLDYSAAISAGIKFVHVGQTFPVVGDFS